MKKFFFTILFAAMTFLCCGQTQVTNKDFAKFISKISTGDMPAKCKLSGSTDCFGTSYVVPLKEAEKYFGYSDKDYYVTEYDYDMDEDIISNIRQVENPLFANNKIIQEKYIIIAYSHYSNYRDISNCDTATEVLSTFTLNGTPIDKIVIQGRYTREFDWIDFIFLSNNTFKIFHYLPNFKNYNIQGGIYYTLDEKQPKTVVEIINYEIDEKGKINLVKTHPTQYLKESVSFYRSYHKDSDDPMNEY